ncbi:MAG: hypothetical protein D6747_08115, partial [Chlorobiota bacterium]
MRRICSKRIAINASLPIWFEKHWLHLPTSTFLDFLSRLLEEEGIFYYFAHDGTRCTMHLSDTV